MKLDVKALTLATALVTASLYALCAIVVALFPGPSLAMFAAIMHANLGTLSWAMDIGTVGTGLVCTTALASLIVYAVGWTYNRLSERGALRDGRALPQS
ncbi:MAG: hypothetical protein IPI67_24105 [Myxococcales bacterium]|nr:hypothetical protein [Myxococcales bacterium]